MKCISTLILLLIAFSGAAAQNLAEVYRSGRVTLQEDPQYGAGTDWKQAFGVPIVEPGQSPTGPHKSLVIANDGAAFVGNYDNYTISKFDPTGKLVKTFRQEGSADGQFRSRPSLHGVLDNRYIFTSEHNGRLTFFDLKGQFAKTLALDYMPLRCVPLRDGKIAVAGFVVWSDHKTRRIVAIIDMTTGEENIVCSQFNDGIELGTATIETDKGQISVVSAPSAGDWLIAATPEGNLLAAFDDDTTVEMYSPDGDRLGRFSMAIDRVKYPEPEKGAMKVHIDRIRPLVETKNWSVVEDAIQNLKYPEFLPYMYSLMVDYDGNLMAFVYTDQKEGHRFQAYRMTAAGELIGKVDLLSDRYELNLNPSTSSVCFANGYVYAVVTPKDTADGTTRLIKGKLVAR